MNFNLFVNYIGCFPLFGSLCANIYMCGFSIIFFLNGWVLFLSPFLWNEDFIFFDWFCRRLICWNWDWKKNVDSVYYYESFWYAKKMHPWLYYLRCCIELFAVVNNESFVFDIKQIKTFFFFRRIIIFFFLTHKSLWNESIA